MNIEQPLETMKISDFTRKAYENGLRFKLIFQDGARILGNCEGVSKPMQEQKAEGCIFLSAL